MNAYHRFIFYILKSCRIVYLWFPRSKTWDNNSLWRFEFSFQHYFETPRFSRDFSKSDICVSSPNLCWLWTEVGVENVRTPPRSKIIIIIVSLASKWRKYICLIPWNIERMSQLSFNFTWSARIPVRVTLQGLLSIRKDHLGEVSSEAFFAIGWWPFSYLPLPVCSLKYLSLGISLYRTHGNAWTGKRFK